MKKSEIIERYGIEEYERRKQNSKQYNKRYHESHKEEAKQYNKQYYQEHKEEAKQYRDSHKEHYKQYRDTHKEEAKQYNKMRWDANKQPCVYAYTDLDGFVVYIGSTVNLKVRERKRRTAKGKSDMFKEIYQASPDKYICHVLQYTDTIEEARDLEKRFIGALNPRYNIVYRTN